MKYQSAGRSDFTPDQSVQRCTHFTVHTELTEIYYPQISKAVRDFIDNSGANNILSWV